MQSFQWSVQLAFTVLLLAVDWSASVSEQEASPEPCGDPSHGFFADSFCCRDRYHEFCYTRIAGVDWRRCCEEHSNEYFGLAEIRAPGLPVPPSDRIDCCEFPMLGGYWLQFPLFGEAPDDEGSREIDWLAWLIDRFREDVEPALSSLRLDLRIAVNYLKQRWTERKLALMHGTTNQGDAPELERIASSLVETMAGASSDVQYSEFASSSKKWCNGVTLTEASAASPADFVSKEFSYLEGRVSQLVSKLRQVRVPQTRGGVAALAALWEDLEAAGMAVGDVLGRGALYVNSHAFLMAASMWGPAPVVQIFAPRGSTSGYKTNVLKHLLLEARILQNASKALRPHYNAGRTARFWRSVAKLPGAVSFGKQNEHSQTANVSNAKGVFVEFGVHQGHTAEYILTNFPDLLYLGVDPYYASEDGVRASYWADADRNLARFGRRALLLHMGTVQAGMLIRNAGLPRGVITAAYEDGVKTYSSTLAGLQLWSPLLQDGGFFAHDDYYNADGAIAMWHYAQQRNYLIQLAGHKTMVCRKLTSGIA